MPNYWLRALKEFNKNNIDEWCIPRKGSEAYTKLQEKVDIYKRTNQNKKQKIKAATKIQGLVKGVQFRQNVLPNIIETDLINKRFSQYYYNNE